jgi:NADPH2:quinone reductase
MKAMIIEEFGGAEKLKEANIPIPKPTDNEIQIKIAYAAVNPADWKVREGLLKGRLPHEFPLILGWDAAGTVTELGKNVRNFKVGDEVMAYCRKPSVHLGTYAEYICLDADFAALKPDRITFAQAAAIPLAGLTAWQSLFDAAKLKMGEKVLIHAGAGGVGSMAIQFAKVTGAYVVTTASKHNHNYVKELGADAAIDYRTENFAEHAKSLVPDGFDVILDSIGGKVLADSLNLLKPGGRLVSIIEQVDPALAKQHRIQFEYVFVEPDGRELKQIGDMVTTGEVVPPHIEEMPLSDAPRAQEMSRKGHTKGKIVLKIV